MITKKHQARELRLQGQSLKQISEAVGLSISQVGRYVKDIKIQPCHPLYKTASIQHAFFSPANIAANPSALVLVGFVAADGCVSLRPGKAQKTLIVRLAHKDALVLHTFNNLLAGGTRTVSVSKKSQVIDFPSDQICDDLARFGIVPRKTAVYTWPAWLSESDARLFLLGYFYGDGCYHRYKNREVIHIVCTRKFAEGLRDFVYLHKIADHCVVSVLKRRPNYAQIVFQGAHARRFGDWLFSSIPLPLLPRKHPF